MSASKAVSPRRRIRPPDRYVLCEETARTPGRAVICARDSLTGRTVVLKTREFDTARREGRCLLALPPGVGPRLLDVLPSDRRRMTLVLEHVAGRTLGELAPRVPRTQHPELVRAICRGLTRVHRTGWVHTDVSPTNLMVRRAGSSFEARLLDFGQALDTYAAEGPARGGTLPFVAPEVAQEWLVDARADLYSTGAVIRELWPDLQADPRWEPILARLLAVYPADRPGSAASLEEEITVAFGLAPVEESGPPFPSGALRGRAADLRRALDLLEASTRPRLLIQARPGTGISRFLLEVALAHAPEGGSPLRIVDLSGPACDSDRALEYLEVCAASSDGLICGVSDPSPDLRWLRPRAAKRLRALLCAGGWDRLDLAAIGVVDFEEMVHVSVGGRSVAGSELARRLHDAGDGDLRIAAAGFAAAIAACGSRDGLSVRIDSRRLARWRREWKPDHPPPLYGAIPVRPRAGLRLCAVLGPTFRAERAAALLDRFAPHLRVEELVSHGYLRRTDCRLEFVTRRLWEEASARRPAPGTGVDAWLVAQSRSEAGNIESTLSVCRAARRSQDTAAERALLCDALAAADRNRRWSDVLRLVSYPKNPPSAWTEAAASRIAVRAAANLGPGWTPDRVLSLIGTALMEVDRRLGLALLERCSRSADDYAAAAALVMLVVRHAEVTDGRMFDRYEAALRAVIARDPKTVPAGALDYARARRAYADRRAGDAQAAAELAQRKLEGTGLMYEALSLQVLAALSFSRDPDAAVAYLERAALASDDPETRAQVGYNMALVHARSGRLDLAAACSERALQQAAGRVSAGRETELRIRRAWDWAAADRAEAAKMEALALLESSTVRAMARHLNPARLLLAYCLLHLGKSREAVRLFALTWRESAGSPQPSPAQSLRFLIDALIDTEMVDVVRIHGQEFTDLRGQLDGIDPLLARRAVAIAQQADGRAAEAVPVLRDGLDQARRLPDALDRVRYLHHLATLLITPSPAAAVAPAAAREAIGHFEEELGLLPSTGRGYYRALALLGRAVAERHAGRVSRARATLAQAITLSRDVASRQVLRRGLMIEATWDDSVVRRT